jgi:hypothetical protein
MGIEEPVAVGEVSMLLKGFGIDIGKQMKVKVSVFVSVVHHFIYRKTCERRVLRDKRKYPDF